MYSTAALIGVLVIGVILGGAGVYFGTHSISPSLETITQTTLITTTSTVSGSSTSGGGLTVAQFLGALKNSTSINLALASFDFGKGSLSVWVVNHGTGPIVFSTANVIYNRTTTGIAVSFGFVDSTVTQVGVYAYIPVGSELYISATPPSSPSPGQNATLQIVNQSFKFTYGTSG